MRKLLCGKNSVHDAINAKIPIKRLYLTRPINLHVDKSIEVLIKTKQELDKMTKENHQGYIAELMEINYYSTQDILKDNPSVVLMLDHIEDPHNLGAIIRTANAAGVKHILLPKDRAAKVTPTVLKVSSGGIVGMKIARVNSLVDAVIKLKKGGYWIYATAVNNGADIRSIDFNKPMVLIVGNEGKGVSKPLLKQSDQNVYIDMHGTVQSLNVSVATGIALFNINNDK